MGDTYDEISVNKEKAKDALKKMKELELKTEMYVTRVNRNTIVFCKNRDKLEDYRKIK